MDSGYRLIDLEVFNWGTFDGRIWHMAPDGHGCLLTGENGTGKSTLIDAFLSLLVPNKKRSYNMSSGSDRRERNETTYVRGAFQREKTRWDQIQVKYLRNEQSLSALAAHFANPVTKDHITVSQFFWFESGELRKCLVISHAMFSLKTALNNIKTPSDLRRNLRQMPQTTIFPSFSEYQDYLIQYMGLRSRKGLDLFNQISTIKQIGNLKEFVRQNMLEEFDMEPILAEFFHTFEDLTLVHQAIVTARLQIESLDGIDKDARKLSEASQLFEHNAVLQAYLPRFFAAAENEILTKRQSQLAETLAANNAKIQSVEQTIDGVSEKLLALTRGAEGKNRDEHLRMINRELENTNAMYERSNEERKKLEAIRSELGFNKLLSPESFAKELNTLKDEQDRIESDKEKAAQDFFSKRQVENRIQQRLQELSADLLASQKNKSLLPRQFLELRQMLCEKLNLQPKDLPYAAELMAVKVDEEKWRFAVEKLLRPLALKLLVPEQYFIEANQVLRSRNIGMKIMLLSVNLGSKDSVKTLPIDENFIVSKLEFLPNALQSAWLQKHIREQFAFQCIQDMRAFRTATRALTVEGLIKRGPGVSEKDDRAMLHSQYILGWTHQDRIKALTEESATLRGQLKEIQDLLQKALDQERQRERRLALLAQRKLFDSFEPLNTSLWKQKFEALKSQQETLMQRPETKELGLLQRQLKTLAKERDEVLAEGAILRNELEKIPVQIEKLAALLSERSQNVSADTELQLLIEKIFKKEKTSTSQFEARLSEVLRSNLADLAETKHNLGINLVRKLSAFKARFPEFSVDLDASLDDLPAFLQKYQILKKEALPTHETRFKKLISKSIVTDLTAFKSTLELNAEKIKEDIECINTSLCNIPYGDASYVQIRMTRTKDPEIREFQSMLRNAIRMKGPEQNELDLDESFQHIRSIIMRLKSDMKWSARVTDVRNWTDFFMVELAEGTDTEISFYSDSSGLSGGQKAKLAFTILASALAYQYGLNSETAREKSFRFVMIDEAFSKSDDRNSQYALALFQKLGLQLLVVTPMDKLDVIKPYIQKIFVTQVARHDYRSQLAVIHTTPSSLVTVSS